MLARRSVGVTSPKLPLAARSERDVTIPFRKPALKPGTEYWLTITFALSTDMRWADRGHVLAWDQFKLPYKVPRAAKADVAAMPPLTVDRSRDAVTVQGKTFALTIGKTSGAIESFEFRGNQLVAAPLMPNFWRAPIDNDRGNGMPGRQGVWREAGQNRAVKTVRIRQVKPQAVRITVAGTLPAGESGYRNVYSVYGSGDVVVEASFTPGSGGGELPDLPRFGMQMALPRE